MVLLLELGPLVGIDIAILPLHVKDLLLWTNEFLRLTVARETPFHLQAVLLVNGRHVVDLPVTGRAADALCYMNAVVKVDVFRQVVDPQPLQRLVIAKARPDRLEIRTVTPQLTVAVHARLRRRHPGGLGGLDRLVTVSTVDSVVTRVMFMAELYRLLSLQILIREVRRTGDLRIRKKSKSAQDDDHPDADAGNIIRASLKELCHLH